VSAAVSGSHVRVTIADDGVGFDVDARERAPAGRGLRNIQQRAAQLGANVEIDSQSTGTTVTLSLPVERRRVPR
jgi:signal transduction histidine kinase